MSNAVAVIPGAAEPTHLALARGSANPPKYGWAPYKANSVTPLGLEPRTPTLNVSCSTN